MLTGELPGKDLQAPSRKFQIDVRLDEIVLQALEKNPALRYQSAGDFRTMVETVATNQAGADAGLPVPSGSRFSRAAIVAACWAPLFFVFLVFWNVIAYRELASVPPGGQAPEPPMWQYLLMFTLLPLGLAAPFGTTILGWIAVSQIRRAAGKLHGMWLAVFDGLLFPLLLMAGLIGWFWHWVFYDLMRAAILVGEPELPTLLQLFVSNTTALTVLATLLSSLFVGFFIIRQVWCAVKRDAEGMPPRKGWAGWAIAIGCGVLVLIAAVVGVFVFVAVAFSKSKNIAHEQTTLVAQMRAEQLEAERWEEIHKPDQTQPRRQLAQYDWKTLAAEGRLGAGVPVIHDGLPCLKIENAKDEPMHVRLLTIDHPPIKEKRYAVGGVVAHENIQGLAYLETWNVFPEDRYFSRTSGDPGSGPMGQLTGTSGWRDFSLPFDRTGTADAPERIEVNLHLPGKGVVFVGPLKLSEVSPDGSSGGRATGPPASMMDELETGNPFGKRPLAAKDTILITEFGDFISEQTPWSIRISAEERVLHLNRKLNPSGSGISFPLSGWFARDGWFAFIEDEAHVWAYDGGENLVLVEDAFKKIQAYGAEEISRRVPDEIVPRISRKTRDKIGTNISLKSVGVQPYFIPPNGAVVAKVEKWLAGIDAGDYARSWDEAVELFRKSITAEAWGEALTKSRKPLGALESRKIRDMKEAKALPGAPDGKYWIIQFDSSFSEKAEAVETVTFMLEKDGTWKAAGYFIR